MSPTPAIRTGFIPRYILERLAECDNSDLKLFARNQILAEQRLADFILAESLKPKAAADADADDLGSPLNSALPAGGRGGPRRPGKTRVILDLQNTEDYTFGVEVRNEGDAATKDDAADEAYDYSGIVYDFYKTVYGRSSVDNKGAPLTSCVHFGHQFSNAFWTGDRMVYGDGDNKNFYRFTRSLDVIGHELTHGVVANESQLIYYGQSGALNEHFADVFGVMIKQWHLGQDVTQADWLVGADLMGPAIGARAIRDMGPKKAFEDNPYLGTDPQPKHMRDIYTGPMDNQGVHINSGIPNLAFYTAARKAGGKSWETVGPVWYRAMLELPADADFYTCRQLTIKIAGQLYGQGSKIQDAVRDGWDTVGVNSPANPAQKPDPKKGGPSLPPIPKGPITHRGQTTIATELPANDEAKKPARRLGQRLRAAFGR